MGQQFIRLFCGRIQAHRTVCLILRAVRHLPVGAIHTGGAGKHQMFCRISPAGFQNIEKTHNIGLYVCVRIHNGITHSRLGGQVYHNLGTVLFKNPEHHPLIPNIALYKHKSRFLLQPAQPVRLQRHIIIIIHIIHTHDFYGIMDIIQLSCQAASDKSCNACD